MKIEITNTSVSKKGTVWMQVKIVEGETPSIGTIFKCEKTDEQPAKKVKKE